jgi:hypothetical protein
MLFILSCIVALLLIVIGRIWLWQNKEDHAFTKASIDSLRDDESLTGDGVRMLADRISRGEYELRVIEENRLIAYVVFYAGIILALALIAVAIYQR